MIGTTSLIVPTGKSEYTKASNQYDNVLGKNTNWFISSNVENFKTTNIEKFREQHYNNSYFLNKDLNRFVTIDDVVDSLNEYIKLRVYGR